MPSPSSENESSTPDGTRHDSKSATSVVKEIGVSYITTAVFGLALIYVIRKAKGLTQDEIALKTLHTETRILQAIATWFGEWAIDVENEYNRMVTSLH